ncbi:MAG: iron chelate uptake ABC transporter family permease subunit, partial [Candidatus Marinimicrobia bacterium]|nr:iron chelate uptake ABC transporter family permease subunit [Candidatus Neomarinimicrobiota bacterium]
PAALRLELFTVVGLLTAAAVALAGPIGFVGLIVPHICRLAGGPGHPRLVRRAGFAGACLLIAADTLCREGGRSLGVGPIPVGVATALTGAPFFLALLRRNPTRTGANP